MILQVFVDKRNCTSCGLCAETHPQYFRMNEYDIAESHNAGANANSAIVSDEHLTLVQVAIDDCPGECIHWNANTVANTVSVTVVR